MCSRTEPPASMVTSLLDKVIKEKTVVSILCLDIGGGCDDHDHEGCGDDDGDGLVHHVILTLFSRSE